MSCWNEIGVYGQSSCPELDKYVHCRNCPVYSAAASELLDGEVSPEQLTQATERLAKQKAAAVPHAHAVLIFRLGAEWMALPSAAIGEIVNSRPIHSLPHRRNGAVLGLVNIRGELLVCIALHFILKLDEAVERKRDQQRAAGARMLVMQQDGARIVYPVENVFGIERFHADDLAPVPAMLAKSATTHIKAVLSWQGHSVSLLDQQLLLATVSRSLTLATAI